MSRTKLLVALIALTLMPFAAHAADISGTWTAAFDTQIGKQEYTYTFKVEGTKLTGKAKSANGESDLLDGKVDGDKVSFVENLNFQGNAVKITYTGKVVSNDEIKFSRDVSGFAQEELTAKRSK
ncbi:MAG TPA: hypothetical protein VGO53_07235 [Steroidobacteraceae bacterium]|nr:hypothetical protein [Steroidobacteraceae bacterium]